jgi:hypothetical protein
MRPFFAVLAFLGLSSAVLAASALAPQCPYATRGVWFFANVTQYDANAPSCGEVTLTVMHPNSTTRVVPEGGCASGVHQYNVSSFSSGTYALVFNASTGSPASCQVTKTELPGRQQRNLPDVPFPLMALVLAGALLAARRKL